MRLHDVILKGRGPLSLTWRAWRAVLRRTRRSVFDDHLSLVAAGSAFFALLALAPGMTALVSVWALFADPAAIGEQLALVDRVLPGEAYEVVAQQMTRIAGEAESAATWGAVLSLLLALWSANRGTRAFIDAFNIVYGAEERRGFVRLSLYSLLLTFLGVALVGVALALVVGLPVFFAALGFPAEGPSGVGLLRWPLLLIGVFAFYLLLGRFAPSRPPAPWRWLWPGAAASALVWLVASVLFSIYVTNFAAFNAVYGSLGAVVILLLWIYLSIYVGLIGAKLNAELERETHIDPPLEHETPHASRRPSA
jgi:membrane protein